MRPEYYTWKASNHTKVACTTCHIEPGLKSFVEHKMGALNQVYQHVFNKYYLPIEMKQDIKNETCLQCHSRQWERTASGDIKVPHSKHLDQGFKCVQCHRGVAHGTVTEREQTIDGQWDKWNDVYGRTQMVQPYKILDMKGCLQCHKEKDAPITCDTCHKKLVKPRTHQTTEWLKVHGLEAARDLDECDRCHSYSAEPITARADTKQASYARGNTFCGKCHLTRPAGHTKDWISIHPAPARANTQGCLTCHDYKKPSPGTRATKTYCLECHVGRHRSRPQVPSGHPVPVAPGEGPSPRCYSCHSKESCTKCHRG